MYCVILLQNHKRIAVPSDWVQHKTPRKNTKIFLSSDETKIPDFELPIKYFIQPNDACYNGFFLGKYREYKKIATFSCRLDISPAILLFVSDK